MARRAGSPTDFLGRDFGLPNHLQARGLENLPRRKAAHLLNRACGDEHLRCTTHLVYTSMRTCLTSRYSSSAWRESSKPMPLLFQPG